MLYPISRWVFIIGIPRTYPEIVSGTYEIASLTGNVTLADEGLFVHLHAAIGDDNFQIFGGHLISAEAGASTEIAITPLNYTIKRKKHPDLNIKIICPFETIYKKGAL